MKGCMTVIGTLASLFVAFVIFVAIVGANSRSTIPAQGGAPLAAAVEPPAVTAAREAQREVNAQPATHRKHRRRHHHQALAPVVEALDPYPWATSLHWTKWGQWSIDAIGIHHIRGTAINNTGHDLSYATVSIRLTDKDGAQVGTATAVTTNLPSGSLWRFDATGYGEGIAHHDAPELTGF